MKKIKSEGAVKSKTPYRMKFIKKVATIASAVVLSAALLVGSAFTLTGCNNEKDPIDPNPPIVYPIPDPEPEPDPEPPVIEPEPEPEPDPDPDPDPNPDPEPEPEPDPMPEYNEIDTLEELYGTEAPVLEDFTEEKYGSNYKEFYNNEVREYNEAQAMQEAIYESLNENLVPRMLRLYAENASGDNVEEAKWFLNGDSNTNIIDSIDAEIMYNKGNGEKAYYHMTVTPKKNTTIDIENLVNPTEEFFDTVFSTKLGGAKFIANEAFTYNEAEQERLGSLLDAIDEKIGSKMEGDVQSFIKPNGGAVDTELGGTASRYVILNVSENGYEEYSLSVLDSSNGKTEIENLNNDKYYTYSEKSATYEGKFLDENSGKDRLEEIEIDKEQTQTKKSVKYVAKVSLPKEDGTFEEFEIEL